MKIFLAGGTGAVGKRLIRSLIRGGHQVVATTRSSEKTNVLAALGAEPVIADGLNRDSDPVARHEPAGTPAQQQHRGKRQPHGGEAGPAVRRH